MGKKIKVAFGKARSFLRWKVRVRLRIAAVLYLCWLFYCMTVGRWVFSPAILARMSVSLFTHYGPFGGLLVIFIAVYLAAWIIKRRHFQVSS